MVFILVRNWPSARYGNILLENAIEDSWIDDFDTENKWGIGEKKCSGVKFKNSRCGYLRTISVLNLWDTCSCSALAKYSNWFFFGFFFVFTLVKNFEIFFSMVKISKNFRNISPMKSNSIQLTHTNFCQIRSSSEMTSAILRILKSRRRPN
jgi:hypothetical protein